MTTVRDLGKNRTKIAENKYEKVKGVPLGYNKMLIPSKKMQYGCRHKSGNSKSMIFIEPKFKKNSGGNYMVL